MAGCTSVAAGRPVWWALQGPPGPLWHHALSPSPGQWELPTQRAPLGSLLPVRPDGSQEVSASHPHVHSSQGGATQVLLSRQCAPSTRRVPLRLQGRDLLTPATWTELEATVLREYDRHRGTDTVIPSEEILSHQSRGRKQVGGARAARGCRRAESAPRGPGTDRRAFAVGSWWISGATPSPKWNPRAALQMTKTTVPPCRLIRVSSTQFGWFRVPWGARVRAAVPRGPGGLGARYLARGQRSHVCSQKRKRSSPIPSSLGKQRPGLCALGHGNMTQGERSGLG